MQRRSTLKPGQDISPTDLGELLVDGRLHAPGSGRRARRVLRPRRHRRLLSGRRRASRSGSSSSATRSSRSAPTIPSTQRSIARDRSGSRSCRCRNCSAIGTRPIARRRVFDYLSGRRPARGARLRARRSRRARREAARADSARATTKPCAKGNRRAAAGTRWSSPWDDVAPWLERRDRARDAGARRRRPSHRVSAGAASSAGRVPDWVAEIRQRRDGAATRSCSSRNSPGRAERTIELLADYDVFAAPIERAEDARYAAVLVAVGQLSRGFRLPDAGLQLYAETDVFEEERATPRAPPLGDQGVPLRLPRPQGRRPRRPRRPRHRRVRRPEADRRRRRRRRSSSSSATPARTSCSSRSSGSTWSRSTPARRGRRSIGSAARRGRRRRRASRRRCATWPRSCSSSTPRARRCPATPSAPTRTGSRSSRTRSSTS